MTASEMTWLEGFADFFGVARRELSAARRERAATAP